MLLALGLALQLAAAAPAPGALTVRMGEQVKSLPIVAHPDGGSAVRADLLAASLGGQLVTDARRAPRVRFEVGATGVDIESGSALALVAGDTMALSAVVFRRGTVLYVPMSLATDLLPRLGINVMYDSARNELRRFAPVTASRRTATPPVAAPSRSGATTVRTNTRSTTRDRVVVVDAGHGGPDRGMSGPIGSPSKIYEKNVTLAVAQQLRRALEARGVKVVMTRSTDTLIALSDRGKIANQAKGDLFLSVHVNAANPRWTNPGGARGFETYFLAEAKTEDERRVEAMENEAIRFETNAETSRDDPLGFIIRDMAQNEHLRESLRLAELIQGGMKTMHPGPNRGVKQAGFRVLVTAFMPAVLVEIGFGTNRAEAAWMTDTQRQAELADTIADAVTRYLAQYERKVGG
jgi:N-acetylmuramoyl-L-alanine amidase